MLSAMEKKAIYRSYQNERDAFARIAELPDEVFSEFESALKSLIYQLNSKILNQEIEHITLIKLNKVK